MTTRFTAALGAFILLFAVTAFFPSVAASASVRSQAVQKQRQNAVTVSLESLKPTILTQKTKKLVVQVKIQNLGARALTGAQVQLLYGERFGTRSQLDQFSQSQTEESTPHTLHSAQPFDLAPGASTTVKLPGNAASAFARYPGELSVYPLAVTVSSPATGRLGGLHTYINYVDKDAKKNIKPTKVSFVWPLIDGPHRTTDDKFYDDRLADLVDPDSNGRLSRLLSALDTGGEAVTLAIDPGLLTDVKAMQQDYRIRSQEKDKPGEEKPKNADASAWLSKLKTYVKNQKNAFFLTPYGDVDSVALVNRRLASGEGNLLKAAYADKKLGLGLLDKQAETYPYLAWTNGGAINQKTIDRLVANKKLGSNIFLLNSNQLVAGNTPYTPSAATTVQTSKGENKTAIAFDDTIQQIISGDTGSPGAALGAQQRYLAETAMITAEAPNLSRTLVVSPDRRWNPGAAFAKSLLNHKDARSAWLAPAPLDKIAAAKTPDRTFVTYADGERELSRHYLEGVKAMNKEAYAFSRVFSEPDTSLQRAAMRVSSNYWRGTGKRRTAAYKYQSGAVEDHKAELNKISLVSGKKDRQLAGSSGVLRLTIANDFAQGREPVDILIEISTYPEKRLVFPDEEGEDQNRYLLERRIEAGQKDTIQVPVKLPTGSSFQNRIELQVKILNRDYREINTQSVYVRTTGFSSIGLFITVGALAVLVLGVGFRGMRARRRRKEEESQHDGAAV
ncbi:DUF6049 family protein [Actinocorallia aurantiaca]|uniref:CARDB protein n=1 Tax=Actinocorallia aurantiaca TaxID=46204 RepID=A0ABN3TUL9_9ACTN